MSLWTHTHTPTHTDWCVYVTLEAAPAELQEVLHNKKRTHLVPHGLTALLVITHTNMSPPYSQSEAAKWTRRLIEDKTWSSCYGTSEVLVQ